MSSATFILFIVQSKNMSSISRGFRKGGWNALWIGISVSTLLTMMLAMILLPSLRPWLSHIFLVTFFKRTRMSSLSACSRSGVEIEGLLMFRMIFLLFGFPPLCYVRIEARYVH